MNVDIREATQRFNSLAKGENKGDILSEFITTINPIVLGIQNKGKNTANQQEETDRLRR